MSAAQEAAPTGAKRLGRLEVEPLPLGPGEVMVHKNLAMLEASDAAELTALLSDKTIASLIIARLSPTVAVAEALAARSLLAAIKKFGASVKLDGEFTQ